MEKSSTLEKYGAGQFSPIIKKGESGKEKVVLSPEEAAIATEKLKIAKEEKGVYGEFGEDATKKEMIAKLERLIWQYQKNQATINNMKDGKEKYDLRKKIAAEIDEHLVKITNKQDGKIKELMKNLENTRDDILPKEKK